MGRGVEVYGFNVFVAACSTVAVVFCVFSLDGFHRKTCPLSRERRERVHGCLSVAIY